MSDVCSYVLIQKCSIQVSFRGSRFESWSIHWLSW